MYFHVCKKIFYCTASQYYYVVGQIYYWHDWHQWKSGIFKILYNVLNIVVERWKVEISSKLYSACIYYLSQCMRFPTMWHVRPSKPQISLRISAVWSEPLLVAWVFYECYATAWTPFGVSKLKRRLQRLARVYTCQNVKLLEISCRGSFSFTTVTKQMLFNLDITQ